MLVKQHIVQNWYRTDSWVFKNFVYLFQNPLWQKKLPKGFSVCPFFWLSLVGFFMKPMVLIIQYLIAPIIKIVGKPLVWVDEKIREMLDAPQSTVGTGAAFGFVLLLLLAFFGIILVNGIKAYIQYVHPSPEMTFFWWTAFSLIPLIGGIEYYRKKDNERLKCRVGVYYRVWAIGVLILTSFLFPGEITKTIVSCLTGITFCFAQMWEAVKFVGAYVWVGLKSVPWFFFLTVLGVLFVLSWAADKIYKNMEFNYRAEWIDIFTFMLTNSYFGEETLSLHAPKAYKPHLLKNHGEIWHRPAVEMYFTDILSALEKTKPLRKWIKDKDCALFYRIEHLLQSSGVTFEFQSKKYTACLKKALQSRTCRQSYRALVQQEKTLEIHKKKSEKRHLRLHKTCNKVTNLIHSPLQKLEQTLKNIGLGVWTFVCYLGMLIKAKKEKACPYFQFEEVKK